MKRDYRAIAEAILLNCEEGEDVTTALADLLTEAYKLRDHLEELVDEDASIAVEEFDEALEDMQ